MRKGGFLDWFGARLAQSPCGLLRLQAPFVSFGLRPQSGLLTCAVYGQFSALVLTQVWLTILWGYLHGYFELLWYTFMVCACQHVSMTRVVFLAAPGGLMVMGIDMSKGKEVKVKCGIPGETFFFCGSWTRDLSGWGWCMPHLTLRKVREPSQVAVLLPGNEPSRFVFASHPRIGWREHLQETLIWACLKMGYNSYFNGEYEHQPLDFDYFQSHGYFFSNQSINYRTRQWIGRRLQGRSWPSVKKSSLFNEQLPTPCDGWFQTTFSKSLGL